MQYLVVEFRKKNHKILLRVISWTLFIIHQYQWLHSGFLQKMDLFDNITSTIYYLLF
jgi:hypothetical protein